MGQHHRLPHLLATSDKGASAPHCTQLCTGVVGAGGCQGRRLCRRSKQRGSRESSSSGKHKPWSWSSRAGALKSRRLAPWRQPVAAAAPRQPAAGAPAHCAAAPLAAQPAQVSQPPLQRSGTRLHRGHEVQRQAQKGQLAELKRAGKLRNTGWRCEAPSRLRGCLIRCWQHIL
jgi:hypothetical protein